MSQTRGDSSLGQVGAEASTSSPAAAPSPPSRRLPGRTASGLLSKPGSLGLNAGASPQTQNLPVKRRGSFQQLKKGQNGSSGGSSEEGKTGSTSSLDSDSTAQSSVLAKLTKKMTHWEKYGTVLVLFLVDDCGSDKDAILQMLSAEGYDDHVSESMDSTLKMFEDGEVFPDIVMVDSDNDSVSVSQLIAKLMNINPNVAIMVLGSLGGATSSIASLQAGATDYMTKPLDLEELIARVGRHVSRQHGIKQQLEKALEGAQIKLQLLTSPSTATGPKPSSHEPPPTPAKTLVVVEETDFEEQMAELSDENLKLAKRVLELEKALKSSQIEVASLSACLSSLSCAGDDTASTEEYKYKSTTIASSVVHARGSSSAATIQDGGGGSGGSYSHMSDDR